MQRTRLAIVLAAICTGSLISTSGLAYHFNQYAYYQDKYNPNSPTYNPSYGGYYQQARQARYYNYSSERERPVYRGRAYRMVDDGQSGYGYTYAQRRTANFPSARESNGRRTFIYDPRQLTWAAYDTDGSLVRTGRGSSGRSYCPDLGRGCRTPTGTYHVYSKQGPYYRSKIFPLPHGGAPMPYAMFFRGGYAIHGSYELPAYNASHGCVRVSPSDAAWLSQNFLSYGSTVIVRPY